MLEEERSIKLILVETEYDEFIVPIEKFDPVGYQHMVAWYTTHGHVDMFYREKTIRNFINIILMDDKYEEIYSALDNEKAVRTALKNCGKRVDELPLSLVR